VLPIGFAFVFPYLGKGGGKRVIFGLHKSQLAKAQSPEFQARIHAYATTTTITTTSSSTTTTTRSSTTAVDQETKVEQQ